MTDPQAGTGPETVTREELTAFCVRHKDYGVPTADAIWDDIAAHREPEYEPGGLYRDARGDPWLYEPEAKAADPGGSWAECPWLKPGSAGAFSRGTPKRPLRKLVPVPSRDAIYATLANVEWPGNCDQLTGRIVRLLEGSDD